MNRLLTLALAQMDVPAGQPEANLARVREFAAQAREAGADLLLLPELWLHGYDLERAADWAAPLGEGGFAHMAGLARQFRLHLAGSLLERHAGGVSNTAVLYAPDGALLGAYRKVHLFRLMQEPHYLVAGDHATLCPTPWGPTGLAICYDLRFPELFRRYALEGVCIIFLPAEWPAPRLEHWRILCRARAIENQVVLAACNRVGCDGQNTFGGHSAVVGPGGEVLVEGGEAEELLTVRVDLSQADALRRTIPILNDRRPELYGVG